VERQEEYHLLVAPQLEWHPLLVSENVFAG